VERLRNYGFDVEASDIFTAVLAGAQIARQDEAHVVAPFIDERALADLGEFELLGGTSGRPAAGERPDAVIVGDLGARWDYQLMQEAFRFLMEGARLIALSRDRYWHRGDGLALDAGAFVVGLEYATATRARLAGKPSSGFFHAALQSLELAVGEDAAGGRDYAMVGDDLWSDVQGAHQAGLAGWLVRTGKFRQDVLESSDIRPDRIIDSVADLPVG